jgi:hypothetical protein
VVIATSYLRAAQAYMLISIPTGTSTIFGVFQAIFHLLFARERQVTARDNDRTAIATAQVDIVRSPF